MSDNKYPSDDDKQQQDERFKIIVGIDFGTYGSGLAYAIPDGIGGALVYIHNMWKDVVATQKPKTSVLFDNTNKVQGYGNVAVGQYINIINNQGWKLFERFKMSLYDEPLGISDITSATVPRKNKTVHIKEKIPATNGNGEEFSQVVFVACLKWLKQNAIKFIRNLERKPLFKKKKFKVSDQEIKWILTVPAIWSEKAKQKMKDWAIQAELIKSENDNGYVPNQFKIVYEPDCASLSIQHAVLRNIKDQLQNDHEEKKKSVNDEKEDSKNNSAKSQKNKPNAKKKSNAEKKLNAKKNQLSAHRPQININAKFRKGDRYILLDVGGGTCDVACHEVLGDFAIAEVLHPSGGPWGACNIDTEFEMLLNKVFSKQWMDEFKQNNPGMYQQLLQNFISDSKTTFYDGMKVNNKQYHNVTIVQNFVDHLIEKLEEEENDDSDDDDDDDEYEEDSVLHKFIKKRCLSIWNNEDFIKFEAFNYNNTYSISMHMKVWKSLFDVIIDKIIAHVEKILESNIIGTCQFIFLVGGFANSLYYQERIKDAFNRIKVVIPELPQLCVVDGAARYGLRPRFMKIRRLSKTYGIKANKPRVNIKNEDIFPEGYIEKHLENVNVNGQNEEHISDCFMIFASKNEKIYINDEPIKRPALKQSAKQIKALIEIYESPKQMPATCDKKEAVKRGQFEVYFDKKIKRIWIEFDYSDTMFTVHAYPDNADKSKKGIMNIRIDYE